TSFLSFFFIDVITCSFIFFFQAEDGIRDFHVTGVQTCALPISFRMRLEFVEGLLDYFRSRRQGNTTNNPNIEYTDILNYTDKCPICRSSCEEDPDFIKIKCNHIFHKSCILQWTKKSTSCPMCRIEL